MADRGPEGEPRRSPALAGRSLARRLWQYQRERFPLLAHGPLIVVFGLSALGYAKTAGGAAGGAAAWPDWPTAAVVCVTLLGVFFQLRVADEVKDAAADAAFRPDRPVPRGLVRVSELAGLAVAVAVAQAALNAALDPRLFGPLLAVWGCYALMSVEFFVGSWLRRRPAAYLLSHMTIMPLMALYATAGVWQLHGGPTDRMAIAAFLAVAFGCGVVLEVGRKILDPADERRGIETYSAAWGRRAALVVWWAALLATQAAALAGAWRIGVVAPMLAAAGLAVGFGLLATARLVLRPGAGAGRAVELASALAVLVTFAALGLAPPALA